MFRRRRAIAEPSAEARAVRSVEERPVRRGVRPAVAVSGFAVMLMRLVRLIALGVCLIIGLAILLIALDASTSSGVVSHLESWGHWLARPFVGMFHLHSHKGTIALNYGIAIIVYLIIAELINTLIRALFAPARRRAATPIWH
jgi:hypothetical protein